MLSAIFPKSISNEFPGHRIALYAFYAVTALSLWRSQHHVFAHDGGAQSIATIPLDSYPTGAADTVVGMFALWGLSQLILALIFLLACVRYRALIPMLYLAFSLEYLGRFMVSLSRSVETSGTAPGAVVNIPFLLLGLVMLYLSARRPKS